MKTLFIECNMGAAGDMLMAALLELLPEPARFIGRLNSLGIPDVHVERSAAVKCGIIGTHVSVRIGGEEEHSHDVPHGHTHEHGHEHHHHEHGHHQHPQDHAHEHAHGHAHEHEHAHEHGHAHEHAHSHNGLAEIQTLLGGLPLPEKVRGDVTAIYGLIAEAESKAHGKPVDTVHFHEVGMMDAVADIAGVCLALHELAPERIVVSPVHVGSGQVKCAHGILPVPAPATAQILQGVPTYGGQIRGELCTPTGAAILKHFADEFGDRPMMRVEAIGYGMGTKDFSVANCVRVFLGECDEKSPDIVEIACNLDDMTGEELGFALETLMESGALDVYIVPIQMKKSRPGHMLVCLCKPEDEDKMVRLILRHTTTLGVRSSNWRRHTMERSVKTVQTEFGDVRIKTASGFGVSKSKPEYEDLARIARGNGLGVQDVRAKAKHDL